MADTRLDDNSQHTGQSWRLLYTGKLDSTDTNFSLGSYRYSSRGYYSFADANQKHDGHDDDLLFRYNKRNRIQASVSQTVAGVSLYLNGYQQDYWGTSKKSATCLWDSIPLLPARAITLPIRTAKPTATSLTGWSLWDLAFLSPDGCHAHG